MTRLASVALVCSVLLVCVPRVFSEEKDNQAFLQHQLIEEGQKKRFEISGFMDVQYRYVYFPHRNSFVKFFNPDKPHFNVNNLNLYLKFNIDDVWLAFAEVGFVYAPTGMSTKSLYDINSDGRNEFVIAPVDNTFWDNQLIMFQYGAITIERAYIEWNKYSFFMVRAGQYLTPCGIWSQDHGAPILTSIRVPATVSFSFPGVGIPRSQSGLEVLGKLSQQSSDFNFDYALYVGNGCAIGPNTFDDEFDGKPALGAFVNFNMQKLGDRIDIDFGASYYWGRRTSVARRFGEYAYVSDNPVNPMLGNTMMVPFRKAMYTSYELKQQDNILGAHLKMIVNTGKLGSFIVQSEFLRQWVREYQGGLAGFSTQYHIAERYVYNAVYAQVEFQFYNWFTPFFRYEWVTINANNIFVKSNIPVNNLYIGGFNIKITPRVVLKLEYTYANMSPSRHFYLYDRNMTPVGLYKTYNDFHIAQASLSVAF